MESPSLMCMFIILSTPSSCLRLPLCLSITLLHFLSQSLCLFLPPWQTCITCLSLIFHFPLPLSIHLLSLFVSFFFHASPLSPSDTPLSSSLPPSPLLCLPYFRHHPPPSCFLLCVCCLFRLTLLLQYRNESIYMSACCGRHSSASVPSGPTANLHIHECTHPHRHTFTGMLHVTCCTILNSFLMSLSFCFHPVHVQMKTLLWPVWNTVWIS